MDPDEEMVVDEVERVEQARPDPEEVETAAMRATDDEPLASSVRFRVALDTKNEDVDIFKRTPTVAKFQDHFTLPVPSSVVRYRNSSGAARVIEGTDFQFVLEEKYDKATNSHDITIRRIQESGTGLRLLRLAYTLVTAFWTCFLFVFAMQILLFLFLDLALDLGITDSTASAQWGAALGAIFGVIPLINGLASAMVIAGAFVMDTWRGHLLVRDFTFKKFSQVFVEWLFFAFFLGLPLFIMCCTLLAGTDTWWTITALVWLFSIGAFFVLFAVNVVFYEFKTSIQVMRNKTFHDPEYSNDFWEVVKRSILIRQVGTYGGLMHVSYLSRGTIDDAEYTDKHGAANIIEETKQERKSWTATLTTPLVKYGWFQEYAEPHRYFSVDDARDVRPFMTAHTWSLEKVFCRPRNSRYIAIVRGAGSVKRTQMKSSLICSLLGSFLVFFIILSVMVYLQAGIQVTMFLLAIAILLSVPNFMSTYRLYKVGKDILFAKNMAHPEFPGSSSARDVPVGESNLLHNKTERDLPDIHFSVRAKSTFEFAPTDSEGLYLVDESYRLNRPSDRVAWILFGLEITFLFAWPVLSLFAVGNWPLALLYFMIVGITGMRYYVNAAIVLEEVGHMDLVEGKSERDVWKAQSRLNTIVGDITRGKSKWGWVSAISIFALAFLGLFAGAVGSGSSTSTEAVEDPTFTYLPQFKYEPIANSLRYPTCQITNALQDTPLDNMADLIFLARVAYRGNSTQRELDSWFGTGVAEDHEEFVTEYRRENGLKSLVVFKLITYPYANASDFAYVAIRGTTNQWEALTDAQLWSAAMLMQAIREILPMGGMWTPIMPQLIYAMTSMQSNSIEKISFYHDTVDFVNYLKSANYSGVAVTGHSLGGGLAIITAAVTKVSGVALSGPNTMLSRLSLTPQLDKEDLDRYTFNIRPQRDLVPLFDDHAQNIASIRCNADFKDVVGCHDSTRALCEVISTCGTNGRPALCECVTVFGFPEPTPIDPNGITFAQACNLTTTTTSG